ncbi:MAG TPA: ATP synthase F1 subunit gamma [Candidatus Limnocylindrales bacterium]|nr:ATP synthase F1 subunit gamma [Candidatus Limnocylindrales bacterium]
MPSLRHIRRRIRSVKNTQQITKAMKMVSAAKLRRAQIQIEEARPYAQKMAEVLSRVARRAKPGLNPLLTPREEKKVELLIITADKGLAGAFNGNVLRKAMEFIRERGDEVSLTLNVVGRKGRDFLRRRYSNIRKEYIDIFRKLSYEQAILIGTDLVDRYLKEEVDGVYVVYTEFKSVMRQQVSLQQLLPVKPQEEVPSEIYQPDYIYEPGVKEVLEKLVPKHIITQIYRYLLESNASEHASRMTAMDAATKNASEVIAKLTLTYNRARQAAITKEIIEVVNGAEALKT